MLPPLREKLLNLALRGGASFVHSSSPPSSSPTPLSLSSSSPIPIIPIPLPQSILPPPSPTTIYTHMAPESYSVLLMTIAMSLHFFGYELVRSASIALFTSTKTGFSSPSALPLALAFVLPCSSTLLFLYTQTLNKHGPQASIRYSAYGCSFIISFLGILIHILSPSFPITTKFLVPLLFIFRESYVTLIATQHWSFIGSVFSHSTNWFSPIGGISSLAAAGSGFLVGPISRRFGIVGLTLIASGALLGSCGFAEGGYNVAVAGGFCPTKEKEKEKDKNRSSPIKTDPAGTSRFHFLSKSHKLFQRVPVLYALFLETLCCQSLSTLMNVAFISSLRTTLTLDAQRAAYSGKFYAIASVISGVLQFGVIPMLMRYIKPTFVWMSMPSLIVSIFIYQLCISSTPTSLEIIGLSFLIMKTLEYSVRGVLNELIYVPLDFESRYVGKEVIGMLGYRLGKSGTSVVISCIGWMYGGVGGAYGGVVMGGVASVVWLGACGNVVLKLREGEREGDGDGEMEKTKTKKEK